MQIILFGLPWFNWNHVRQLVQSDILRQQYVQFAPAKTGIWLRFVVADQSAKTMEEIFIRTVPLNQDNPRM